ncbi:MAG: DUF1848 family protein, partial [Deltaproteobacteria bacterium]|nr:DUF1848 family protein [Deltaproteobacteria bacterium]
SPEARKEQAKGLARIAVRQRMAIHFCSVPGFPVSRCIDGELLGAMHPEGLPCSRKRARGQRIQCGCTESMDIGWYSLRCQNGCIYCYATP